MTRPRRHRPVTAAPDIRAASKVNSTGPIPGAERVDPENDSPTEVAPTTESPDDQSDDAVEGTSDAGTTTVSYLSSVAESQQTPGRSRVSDLGSLNTIARSDLNSEPENSAVLSEVAAEEEEEEDGDGELDSLDSHLPDFRTIPNIYTQQQGVLPLSTKPSRVSISVILKADTWYSIQGVFPDAGFHQTGRGLQ